MMVRLQNNQPEAQGYKTIDHASNQFHPTEVSSVTLPPYGSEWASIRKAGGNAINEPNARDDKSLGKDSYE